MNLVALLIVASIAIALANAQNDSIAHWNHPGNRPPLIRNDDYLNAYRRQFNANIQNFELQVQTFKDLYTERIKILEVQSALLLDTFQKIDNRLYPLELLSDISKNCVNQYKSILPSLTTTKTNLKNCISSASGQLYSLQSSPSWTLGSLENYYRIDFEKLITNCGPTTENSNRNYTLCITNAIVVTNSYTQSKEKSFNAQLRSSKSSAENYIQQAIQCSFSVQNQTVSAIAKVSTLIERCVFEEDNGNSRKGYLCQTIQRLPWTLQDNKNETIPNPLYGRNETVECLVLDTIRT